MDNFLKDGKRVTWTNGTGAAVSAGDLVVVEDLAGVAVVDIANAALGELQVEGVFDLPKAVDSSSAISFGQALYYDSTNEVVTTTASTNKRVGTAVEAAVAATAVVATRFTE